MILVLNPGSSSIKYKLYDLDIEKASGDLSFNDVPVKNFAEAAKLLLEKIDEHKAKIDKVGIRVVHGGSSYSDPVIINDKVLSCVEEYSKFAPLHNPAALEVVEAIKGLIPTAKIYAVFDTAFFTTLPKENSTYAIPNKVSDKYGIKRFGFHGLSHSYCYKKVDPERNLKVITVHLGAGSSVCAIDKGKVLDTSMGMTPSEGLVMQTRSGDIDPGIILFLVENLGLDETKQMLNKESGLAGLTDTDGGMTKVLSLAGEKVLNSENDFKTVGNSESAKLALKIYTNRIKKYIGAYAAILGGVDVICFTGKIGFLSPVIREYVMEGLEFLNINKIEVIEPDEENEIYSQLKNK